jgi:hypothetical protein
MRERHQTQPRKVRFQGPKRYVAWVIISERGIKANLEKITTITQMGPIQNIKGV